MKSSRVYGPGLPAIGFVWSKTVFGEGEGMRYLVTGGAGIHRVNYGGELVRGGHNVVVLDDMSSGKVEKLSRRMRRVALLRTE